MEIVSHPLVHDMAKEIRRVIALVLERSNVRSTEQPSETDKVVQDLLLHVTRVDLTHADKEIPKVLFVGDVELVPGHQGRVVVIKLVEHGLLGDENGVEYLQEDTLVQFGVVLEGDVF